MLAFGINMIVKNQWFAGIVSTPFYAMAFLGANHLSMSSWVYLLYGLVILYMCGISYYYVVIRRAEVKGYSQTMVISQWLAIQVSLLIAWYLYVVY